MSDQPQGTERIVANVLIQRLLSPGGRLGGDQLPVVLGGSTTHRDGGDANAEDRDVTDRAQGDQAVAAVFR